MGLVNGNRKWLMIPWPLLVPCGTSQASHLHIKPPNFDWLPDTEISKECRSPHLKTQNAYLFHIINNFTINNIKNES